MRRIIDAVLARKADRPGRKECDVCGHDLPAVHVVHYATLGAAPRLLCKPCSEKVREATTKAKPPALRCESAP